MTRPAAVVRAELVAHLRRAAELVRELDEDRANGLAKSPDPSVMDRVNGTIQEAAKREPLLSVSDLAERLSVSPRTIREWRRQGTLPPAIELAGSIVRWRAEAFETWLDEREGEA